MLVNDCTNWPSIERASDRESDPKARIAAARHVRGCASCHRELRAHVALRRSLRSTYPMLAIDPAVSARLQAVLMFQRNAALQTWLRRCTAVAAAVLVACTLSATFARSESTVPADDAELFTPVVNRETDTPQHVTNWIVHDLTRSR